MLGRERERLQPGLGGRAARALDELYGQGRGEGARGDLGGGGGTEAPFPNAREWSEELAELFGEPVREEVLGRAAERGRPAALLALDPDAATPSMELLERVLSLKGGLDEGSLTRLRRLVDRCVEELVRELATRLQPALTGLATPRPTRRPRGPIDLARTIRKNLATARRDDDGTLSLVPEHLLFRTRQKKSLDWQVVLVVDVSGSMDESVVYSALVGAILAGVPWVSVKFVAFSTEIVDLSDRVDDPLALLMEVQVGGGTDIGKGLRYARSLVKVPARTIVAVVTDFEEGVSLESLLSEVRALVESGAHALGLAALADGGKARYSVAIAEQVVAAGMPVAALTPLELARWIGEKVR